MVAFLLGTTTEFGTGICGAFVEGTPISAGFVEDVTSSCACPTALSAVSCALLNNAPILLVRSYFLFNGGCGGSSSLCALLCASLRALSGDSESLLRQNEQTESVHHRATKQPYHTVSTEQDL
jgi:hypothetical protein